MVGLRVSATTSLSTLRELTVGRSMGLGGIGVLTLAVVGVCLFLPGGRELDRADKLLKLGRGLGESDGPGQSLQA
jgi:hypothetical protein